MKKFLLILTALFILISCSACSIITPEQQAELDAYNAELESKKAELKEITDAVSANTNKFSELTDKIKDLNKTIDDLNKQIELSTNDKNTLHETVDKYAAERDKISAEIISLKAEAEKHSELLEDLEEFNTNKAAMEQQYNELVAQVAHLQSEFDRLTPVVDELLLEEQRKLTEGITVFENDIVKVNFFKNKRVSSWAEVAYSSWFWIENKTNETIRVWQATLSFDGMSQDHELVNATIAPQSKSSICVEYDVQIPLSPKHISGTIEFNDYDYHDVCKADFVNVNVQ